jgi:nucleotide-binding universal stress UspA family protein
MSVEHRQDVTTDDEKALIEWGLEQVSTRTPQIEEQVLNPRGLTDGIRYITGANNIDTLVVPGDSMKGRLRRSLPERIALRAECDIVTVNGRYGYEQVPSILLAVAGGPHSGLATDMAQYIATDCDSWIDILYVIDEDASEHQRQEAESYVETISQRIGRPESTTTWVLEAEDVANAIIEQSAYYGLTILGSPSKGRLQRFISGSTSETIRDNAESAVLSAWSNH